MDSEDVIEGVLMGGGKDSTGEALIKDFCLCSVIFSLGIQIYKEHPDDYEAVVKFFVNSWKKRNLSGISGELNELAEYKETPAGKMMSAILPDVEDVKLEAAKKVNEMAAIFTEGLVCVCKMRAKNREGGYNAWSPEEEEEGT